MNAPIRVFKFKSSSDVKECFCDLLSQTTQIGIEYDELNCFIQIFEECVMFDHAIQICKHHGGYDVKISEYIALKK